MRRTDNIETGTVKKFFPAKGYGFISREGDSSDVYFNMKGGRHFDLAGNGDVVTVKDETEIAPPREGTRITFVAYTEPRDYRQSKPREWAGWWGYANEYSTAKEAIHPDFGKIRVVKRIERVETKLALPLVMMFQGTDEELKKKHPRHKDSGFDDFDSKTSKVGEVEFSITYRFERCNAIGQWEPSRDPRPHPAYSGHFLYATR